jgi:CHAT domain-containing protein/Flp pilus assembly protein TadD
MKTLLLVLCILSCSSLFSQTFDDLKTTFNEQFGDGDFEAAAKTADQMIVKAKAQFGIKHNNYGVALFFGGEANYSLKNFKKAISYYNLSCSVFIKINGTEELEDVALMRNSIGTIYYATKKYDSAIYYYKKSAEYYLANPSDYKTVYTVCNNLIEACNDIADYAKVVLVAEKLLPVILAQPKVNDEHYYSTLMSKGQALFMQQQYSVAAVSFRELLYLSEKMSGKESTDYSAVHILLFRCNRLEGKNAEAEDHLNNAVVYALRSNPIDTSWVISIYAEGGTFFTETAEFSKADSFYNEGISWCIRADLLSSDTYFTLLYQKSAFLIQSGDEAGAKQLIDEILQLMQKANSENELLKGQLYAAVCNAEVQLAQYILAEKHARQAIEILQRLQPEGTMEESMAYQALGALYGKLSKTQLSIEAFEKAIEVSRRIAGENNKLEAIIYSNLGNTYLDHGDFAKAETYFINAIQINYKLYGGYHPYYAISVANLGLLYIQQGRYTEADKFLAEVITIYQHNNMMASINARLVINNLAYMYLVLGDYKQARDLYDLILKDIDVTDKSNADILFYVYHNFTYIYEAERKFDSVIYYENRAIELLRDNGKTRTDGYIKACNSLLRAYTYTGEFDKATKLGEELITLTKEVLGDDSQTMSLILSNLAWLEKKKNNVDKAAAYISQSGSIALNNFRKNFYILSEKEKLLWWTKESYQFDMFPIILKHSNITSGKLAAELMDQRLQIKGFVLQDAAAGLRRAREKGSAAVKELIDEWEAAKTLLSKMYALPVAERTYDVDSLENVLNMLEKRISREGSVEITSKSDVISWSSIKDKLKDDEAAIEFFGFKYYDNDEYKDSTVYAAMIIRQSFTSPEIVYLTSEKTIAAFLSGGKESKQATISRLYRSSIKTSAVKDDFLGDSLYNAIWKPLMPYLSGIKKISFAPDGILHRIAFQALPVQSNTLLIDSFQLQQYSSIKQLLDAKEEKQDKWSSVLLLGNPDFNNTVFHGKTISFTGKGEWQSLSGTAQEIIAIQNLFMQKGVTTKTLTALNANEENFKKVKPDYPDILHLATHGFFLKDTTQATAAVAGLGNDETLHVAINPLLRCGLVLAGANNAWSGVKLPAGAEDGVLNAYEISQLNLTKTKLVVLSACETALGEVQSNEGVFGLQRAFKMAGAKNLVVSLWQVPDKETAELMTLFYGYLLNKYSVRDAFYKAQKEMRKKYAPFSWAAFVLIE